MFHPNHLDYEMDVNKKYTNTGYKSGIIILAFANCFYLSKLLSK